ncbi:MAG: alkylglycerol monooxygenase [Halieaceae bacterium]|jgi:alkylglycerol monooxygenase
MNLIPYAVPFFLLLILMELGWGFWKNTNTYRVNDTVNSLSLGILSTATQLVSLGIGGAVFAKIEQDYALLRWDINSISAWILGLLLYDFLYYWYHRISHERQIFWGSHVVHHQSEDYNLGTALRQTSTSFMLTWIFYVPCFLLGMPIYMFVTIGGAHLIYQFWIHTRHIPKLGFLEWFMITPSNHRVHHAQNSRYIDKNYGGLLIIWDRIFGTFAEEAEGEEVVYGISTPLSSWNPLWANTHIFVQMASDAWRTASWKDKLKVWISRTGWRPADVAEQYPRAKTDLNNFSKYHPPLSTGALAAIFVHFLLLAAVDMWFSWNAADQSFLVQACYVGLLFYTLVVIGAALNRSPRVLFWELSRWVAIASVLTLTYVLGAVTTNLWLGGIVYLLLSAPLMVWAARSMAGPGGSSLPASA